MTIGSGTYLNDTAAAAQSRIVAAGGNGIWTATVPSRAAGADVAWYCTATNSAGGSASTPVVAPGGDAQGAVPLVTPR